MEQQWQQWKLSKVCIIGTHKHNNYYNNNYYVYVYLFLLLLCMYVYIA